MRVAISTSRILSCPSGASFVCHRKDKPVDSIDATLASTRSWHGMFLPFRAMFFKQTLKSPMTPTNLILGSRPPRDSNAQQSTLIRAGSHELSEATAFESVRRTMHSAAAECITATSTGGGIIRAALPRPRDGVRMYFEHPSNTAADNATGAARRRRQSSAPSCAVHSMRVSAVKSSNAVLSRVINPSLWLIAVSSPSTSAGWLSLMSCALARISQSSESRSARRSCDRRCQPQAIVRNEQGDDCQL